MILTSVLNGLNANEKVEYGVRLVKEFGLPDIKAESENTLTEAYQQLLTHEKEAEAFRQKQRKEHIDREAKAWANKLAAVSTYY